MDYYSYMVAFPEILSRKKQLEQTSVTSAVVD